MTTDSYQQPVFALTPQRSAEVVRKAVSQVTNPITGVTCGWVNVSWQLLDENVIEPV